jgi:hypothetical protein
VETCCWRPHTTVPTGKGAREVPLALDPERAEQATPGRGLRRRRVGWGRGVGGELS